VQRISSLQAEVVAQTRASAAAAAASQQARLLLSARL
jgi:hypothetical protein